MQQCPCPASIASQAASLQTLAFWFDTHHLTLLLLQPFMPLHQILLLGFPGGTLHSSILLDHVPIVRTQLCIYVLFVTMSGEGPAPVWLGSVSTGIDPMCRGLASLKGPWSLLSQQSEWSLQGLTCEKKTESILVKAADLYSNKR